MGIKAMALLIQSPRLLLSLSLTLLLRGVFAMPWFRRNVLTRCGLSPWASVHFQPPVSKVSRLYRRQSPVLLKPGRKVWL